MPPAERLKEIPGVVSAIVMKLLAKTAEDRYQTAAGLESDLRRCQTEWEAQRRIDDFPLGEHDTPDRLLIPEKLYGRRREVETLLAAFDRVVNGGAPELVLVSGYSGIGKSSVVNELQPVLVPPRGLFASGQVRSVQARHSLFDAGAGLSEPDPAAARQRAKRTLRLGATRCARRWARTRRLMVDLVPEVKLIIGEPAAGPRASATGRATALPAGVSAVHRRLRPAGTSSGAVPRRLAMARRGDARPAGRSVEPVRSPHLLLIGAYRDNEVTASASAHAQAGGDPGNRKGAGHQARSADGRRPGRACRGLAPLRRGAGRPARRAGAREDRRQSVFRDPISSRARRRGAPGLRSRAGAMVLRTSAASTPNGTRTTSWSSWPGS